MIWEFEVFYTTHDFLRFGIREAASSHVQVIADSEYEAWVFATDMVIYRTGFYVTRTRLADVKPESDEDGGNRRFNPTVRPRVEALEVLDEWSRSCEVEG